MVASYVPDRGDVVWLQFDPQAGREQAGHRPAVVITPAAYNGKVGLAICCPVTSRAKGYPFEVRIPPGGAVSGVVLTDQVKSLDWRVRQADLAFTLPEAVMREVLGKLGTLIAPGPSSGS